MFIPDSRVHYFENEVGVLDFAKAQGLVDFFCQIYFIFDVMIKLVFSDIFFYLLNYLQWIDDLEKYCSLFGVIIF